MGFIMGCVWHCIAGGSHCAKLNMNEKTKQVLIQLSNIARTLFDAKKIIKKIFLWTPDGIQFIRFENHMDGPG